MKKSYKITREEYMEFVELFVTINICNEIKGYQETGEKILSESLSDFNEYYYDCNKGRTTVKNYKKIKEYLKENLIITKYEIFEMLVETVQTEGFALVKEKINGTVSFHNPIEYMFIPFVDCIHPKLRVKFLKKYFEDTASTEIFWYAYLNKMLNELRGNKNICQDEIEFFDTLKKIKFSKSELTKRLKRNPHQFKSVIYSYEDILTYISGIFRMSVEGFKAYVEKLDKEYERKVDEDSDYEDEPLNKFEDNGFDCVDYTM